MKIGRFIRSSLSEWKGKNSCVIEVRGSVLRSPYLCNPDIFDTEGPCIEEDEILDYISPHTDSLEAVVLSGGEPLAQDDLYPFLKKLKQFRLPILLRTEGTRPEVLDDLTGACMFSKVSLCIYDDPGRYNAYGREVLRTIKLLESSDVEYEIELLAIPGITDTEVCSNVAGMTGKTGSITIRHYALPKQQTLPTSRKFKQKEVLELYQAAKKYCKKVELKGF